VELDELIKELDKKLIVTGKEIIDGIMYIYIVKQKSKLRNVNIVETKVKTFTVHIKE